MTPVEIKPDHPYALGENESEVADQIERGLQSLLEKGDETPEMITVVICKADQDTGGRVQAAFIRKTPLGLQIDLRQPSLKDITQPEGLENLARIIHTPQEPIEVVPFPPDSVEAKHLAVSLGYIPSNVTLSRPSLTLGKSQQTWSIDDFKDLSPRYSAMDLLSQARNLIMGAVTGECNIRILPVAN